MPQLTLFDSGEKLLVGDERGKKITARDATRLARAKELYRGDALKTGG